MDPAYMDEENHAERARQDALWALRGQPETPVDVRDEEVTPQQLRDETFAKSPFGAIDRTLKAGTDWIKGRMKKRQAPFEAAKAKDQEAGLSGFPTNSWPDPVELIPTMLLEGGRTANRWLYGTKDPTQLRDEDTLGPLGMSTMAAPFAAMKHGVSLGSAGGKLAGTGNPGSPPFSRQVDDLGYYSKLDEVLGTLKPTDTVTMDTLAKRGVKAAEIEARGLSPFMADGKGAKVADLQGGAQPVQVRESQYGGPAPANWEYLAKGQYGKPYSELSERARLDIRRQSEVDDYKDPKWRDYATDGDNPSYHEGVLHLPLKPYDQLKPGESGAPEFRSGHWDEPNAIAHYRASMQPTEGGGKAYLIDELQSDWGQKLRDGGVRDEAKIADLRRRHEEAQPAFDAVVSKARAELDELGIGSPGGDPVFRAMYAPKGQEAVAQRIIDEIEEAGSNLKLINAELRTAEAATPGNPFVNTSEQWMTTALRRMMRNAAEQEADGIAITPGAVHNERFGLEKQIKELEYDPESQILTARPHDGRRGITEEGVTPEKLAQMVGKEAADRLLATPVAPGFSGRPAHILGGQDLRMGGEGMKYAYDKILPKLLGKELSKLDPSIKYGQQELLPHDTGRHLKLSDSPFHHFPLTPKAREEIMKGLPLFNKADGSGAAVPFEAMRSAQALEGQPESIRAYHGASNPYEGDGYNPRKSQYGAFFASEDPGHASSFARSYGDAARVYPVDIDSKAKLFDPRGNPKHADMIAKAIEDDPGLVSGSLMGKQSIIDAARKGDGGIMEMPGVKAWLKRKKFDGWKFEDTASNAGATRESYGMLKPGHVRSATTGDLLYGSSEGPEAVIEALRAQQQLQGPFAEE